MVFLDPTSDIAFKKLFGNQAKKEILLSFLNSILGREEGQQIVDITFTDPANNPDTGYLKFSIVDVRCIDQSGKQYIIEVQVRHQDDYPERVQHYVSQAIARQLGKSGKYRDIMPVIFIGIMVNPLFKSTNYLSHHNIRDIKTQEHALRHMDFYFIELSKFNKKLEELSSVTDKWIYLLKNAEDMDTIPQQLQSPIELEEAMDELKQGNLSREEIAAYDAYLDARRVAISVEETAIRIATEKATEEGMQKGMQKGLEKGMQEGIAHGVQQGEKAKAHAIATEMLKNGFDIEIVSKITKLPIEEIKKNN